ncbi:MAG: hypothetical protein F6K37_14245 [Moorea sp. SIO4E2]|uniref:hypothetical protein n=1 Tax=Moorena sp. SIO4E2 TaxID=2607826 RepID=UPI0013B7A9EF|nr:hypothetical protein [Moorena sp. SIO4E2]NEQ07055.1 hypothetical protein [Moorena sp. SIO4E2]
MPSNYSYLVARPPPNLNVQLLKATSAISYQLSAISYQLMRTLREQLLNKIS